MNSLIAPTPLVNIGDVFGRLTVIGVPFVARFGKNRRYVTAVCECACGKCVAVKQELLRSSKTKSCGCLVSEQAAKLQTIHGDNRRGKSLRLYRIWKSMRRRCDSPSAISFKYYGARGISVCDDWNQSYVTFKEWALANGYDDTLSKRIDNDGNYQPENCEWITNGENTARRNRRCRKG